MRFFVRGKITVSISWEQEIFCPAMDITALFSGRYDCICLGGIIFSGAHFRDWHRICDYRANGLTGNLMSPAGTKRVTGKIEPQEMLMEDRQNSIISIDAGRTREGSAGVEALLESLADGRLGQRITDTARLAYARHMLCSAQEMRSAVEAENSSE
jgi:hypothetical protein